MKRTISRESNFNIVAIIVFALLCLAISPALAQTTDSVTPVGQRAQTGAARTFNGAELSFAPLPVAGWIVKTDKGDTTDTVKILRPDERAQIIIFNYRISVTEDRYRAKQSEVFEGLLADMMNGWRNGGLRLQRQPARGQIGGVTTEGARVRMSFSDGSSGYAEMYPVLLGDRPTIILFITEDEVQAEAARVWESVRASLRASSDNAPANYQDDSPAASLPAQRRDVENREQTAFVKSIDTENVEWEEVRTRAVLKTGEGLNLRFGEKATGRADIRYTGSVMTSETGELAEIPGGFQLIEVSELRSLPSGGYKKSAPRGTALAVKLPSGKLAKMVVQDGEYDLRTRTAQSVLIYYWLSKHPEEPPVRGIDSRLAGSWKLNIEGGVRDTTDGYYVYRTITPGAGAGVLTVSSDGSYTWVNAEGTGKTVKGIAERTRPHNERPNATFWKIKGTGKRDYMITWSDASDNLILIPMDETGYRLAEGKK